MENKPPNELLLSDSYSTLGTNMDNTRADSRFVPIQWETVLLCNDLTTSLIGWVQA